MRIQDLAGFKKIHRVPQVSDWRSDAFVAGLVCEDIKRDLDNIFAELRQAFRFKRTELRVADLGDGTGLITTPYFAYSICGRQNAAQPAEVIWDRRVTEITMPAKVFGEPFCQVFGSAFDAIEFSPASPIALETLIDRVEQADDSRINIDFDRDVTWCSLIIEQVSAKIRVTTNSILVVHTEPQNPRLLLESFLQVQEVLSHSLETESSDLQVILRRP